MRRDFSQLVDRNARGEAMVVNQTITILNDEALYHYDIINYFIDEEYSCLSIILPDNKTITFNLNTIIYITVTYTPVKDVDTNEICRITPCKKQ